MTKFAASNVYMDPRVTIDTELASAVAVNGTFTLGYPSGISVGSAKLASRHFLKLNDGIRLYPYDGVKPGFTVSFGDTEITLTNKTNQAFPAGTKVRFVMDVTARDMTSAADTLNGPIGQTFANAENVYVAGQFRCAELRTVLMHLGQPAAEDVDFIAESFTHTAGDPVPLTNQQLDTARTITVDSDNAGDTGITLRVYGLDTIGEPLGNGLGYADLPLNGTTAVESDFAVTYVTALDIVADGTDTPASSAGAIVVGTGGRLGLPMKCIDVDYQIHKSIEDTHDGSPTVLLASAAGALITEGDASDLTKDKRGLYDPQNAFDGGYDYFVYMFVTDPTDGGEYLPKDQTQRS